MATKMGDIGLGDMGAGMPPEGSPAEDAAESPETESKEQDAANKQLEGMDPKLIVEFLKGKEILPKDFTIPEKAPGGEATGGMGDIGLSDLPPAPAAPGA